MDLAKVGDRVVCQCKGGPHSIISGASTATVDGIPIARVGDKSSCGAAITTGADWYSIEGAPAAIHGSTTSCGGFIEAASTVVTGSPTTAGARATPPWVRLPRTTQKPYTNM
ncbi:PAAR domain-containing protein [Aidingimonas halophila]